MTLVAAQQPADLEFAADFLALNALIEACAQGEKVALLLSTCRNAYLTINAMFVDAQILLGGEGQSLRGAAELLARGEIRRAGELLGRASQTLSQFEAKKDVWSSRKELWRQVEVALSSIGQSDRLAADRVKLMLGNVRSLNDQLPGGWHEETLAFNLDERSHLVSYETTLARVGEILRSCIRLGKLAAIDSAVQQQGSLELFETVDRSAREEAELGDAAMSLGQLCDWSVDHEGDEVVIELFGARSVRGRPDVKKVRLPWRSSGADDRKARIEVGLLIREAMYRCHDLLTNSFKPNVAQRPMSDPFVIELPAEVRAATRGKGRELKVQRIRCRSHKSPLDSVRVAVANLAVPEAQLDEYKVKSAAAEKVALDVRLAVREAVNEACQAVIFPEYSVPKMLCDELFQTADDNKIVIIGGLEGDWKGNKLVDQALVAIPGETKLHLQLKQEPSLYEEAATAFHSDNVIKVFSGSSIGDFAVTICSDWLESATMRVWTPDQLMPEVHVVVARNNYVDLYRSFAVADSMRFYAAVVVANICQNGDETSNDGSCVVVPHGKRPELEAKSVPVAGTFCKSLSVFDLNMRAIRARSRGKPDQGYLAVPKSAQRKIGDEH